MKLSTYHKLQGDSVNYTYGMSGWHRDAFWDVIYITSMFTFDFKELIRTIRFYSQNLFNFRNIQVGGVAATLLADRVEAETGIAPHQGTLRDRDPILATLARKEKWAKYLQSSTPCIDYLPPDYSIFGMNGQYDKIIPEAHLLYATKGCNRRCSFCAVHTLEPNFVDYIPIRPRVEYVIKKFGEKRGMLLLDNNVVASNQFNRIIDEIKDLGFQRGSKLNKKQRFVDFNQGVDARMLDRKKMKKFSEIEIHPLRLAFDSRAMESTYVTAMKLAIDCGIHRLSNYMLYNYNDKPVDLYHRMRVNIELNEKYGMKIFSFPMKYIPLNAEDRSFIGPNWTKREIRGFQLILNVTKGIVSSKRDFFQHAFGSNEREYQMILLMPQAYILNRVVHEADGTINDWKRGYLALSDRQRSQLKKVIEKGPLRTVPVVTSKKLQRVLDHYGCEADKYVTQDESKEL